MGEKLVMNFFNERTFVHQKNIAKTLCVQYNEHSERKRVLLSQYPFRLSNGVGIVSTLISEKYR